MIQSHVLRTSSISSQNLDVKYLLKLANMSSNKEQKIDFLHTINEYPSIMNLIKYSSESLYNVLKNEVENINDKKLDNVITSVYKYLLRYSTRPTPNGYFGISTLININNEDSYNKIKLIDKKFHIEISGRVIFSLYNFIIKNLEFFQSLKINKNKILNISNQNYSLPIRGENPKANEDDYIIYNRNKVIDDILNKCNMENSVAVEDIVNILMNNFSLKKEESIYVIKNLLHSRILVLQIYPEQLDIPNFQRMVNHLKLANEEFTERIEYFRINEIIKDLLNEYNEEKFYYLRNYIKEKINIDKGVFINTEAIFNSPSINLNISNIEKLVNLLKDIENLPSMENVLLNEYRNKFLDKYGYNIAININELFDEIDGLGSPFRLNKISKSSLNIKEQFEKELRLQLQKNKDDETIYITDELIKRLSSVKTSINECSRKSLGLDINYKVFSSQDDYFNIMLQSTPITYSPYCYRGRFNFLNKDTEYIDGITKLKYISHNSDLWEVQASYQSTKNEININENIYISLNEDGRFIILDENKRSLSVSTFNMTNLNMKSDQVKFLETISSTNHNINYIINLLREISLERYCKICYENIIIINKSKYYKSIEKIKRSGYEYTLEKNDQYIPLNLKNKIDCKIISKEIDLNGGIWLSSSEVSDRYNYILDYNEQELNCEIISTFIFDRDNEYNEVLSIKNDIDLPLFFNGQKGWIYMKIYLYKGVQDNFILNNLSQIIDNNEMWFFIRYEDPLPHIRLRVFVEDFKGAANIFDTLYRYSIKGIIKKYKFDTYEPEYNRYGGIEYYSFVNKIFNLDSMLVFNYIKKFKNKDNLLNENEILDNIVYILDKIKVPNQKLLNILYDKEKMKDKSLRKKYDNIFLNNEINLSSNDNIDIMDDIVKNVNYLINKMKNENYTLSIIDSLLHMHFNRLFGDNKIENEYRTFLYRKLKRMEFIS